MHPPSRPEGRGAQWEPREASLQGNNLDGAKSILNSHCKHTTQKFILIRKIQKLRDKIKQANCYRQKQWLSNRNHVVWREIDRVLSNPEKSLQFLFKGNHTCRGKKLWVRDELMNGCPGSGERKAASAKAMWDARTGPSAATRKKCQNSLVRNQTKFGTVLMA